MDNMDLSKFAPPKFVPPKDAEIIKDVQYSSQGHVRQRLDLYLPKPENRRQGRIPLIVYIHGIDQAYSHYTTSGNHECPTC